jgi:uncharacterized membrane protein YraQ (UPF0718 family)
MKKSHSKSHVAQFLSLTQFLVTSLNYSIHSKKSWSFYQKINKKNSPCEGLVSSILVKLKEGKKKIILKFFYIILSYVILGYFILCYLKLFYPNLF